MNNVVHFQSESSSAPPDTYVKVQLMHHTKVSELLAILRRHATPKSGPTFDRAFLHSPTNLFPKSYADEFLMHFRGRTAALLSLQRAPLPPPLSMPLALWIFNQVTG